VEAWSNQRGEKIGETLNDIRVNSELLEKLMGWMLGAEATLIMQDQQPIPDNVPIIEQLLQDHLVCVSLLKIVTE